MNKRPKFALLEILIACLVILLVLCIVVPLQSARAADLTYSTLIQDGDSDLVRANKEKSVIVNGNSYRRVATANTTVVKSGSGVLDRLTINQAGTNGTFTLYDNTAGNGTVIANGTSTAQASLLYGVRFSTGLTIVTANSTGTAADITISYR